MNRATEKTLADRAVALGRAADSAALAELVSLTGTPFPRVRRLAASAIGKLAGLADAIAAVAALRPLLLDTHPQTRQYAIKALRAYGTASECALQTLRDIAANPTEKEYNRADATAAINAIEETLRIAAAAVVHTCQRCGKSIAPDEYARSQRFFQRDYCDHCFDFTATSRRIFETKVEDQKTIRVCDGTLVQSDGEKKIAEWLTEHGIVYRYDARLRIIEGFQIRPDFYLPEYDIFIEYWGMDTPRYKAGMYLKQDLYLHTGKKLISIYPQDKPHLDRILAEKLLRINRTQKDYSSSGVEEAQRSQPPIANNRTRNSADGVQRVQPPPPAAPPAPSVDGAQRSQPPSTEKHK